MSKKGDEEEVLGGISSFLKTDKDYTIEYAGGEEAKLSILNNHVFRYYMSPTRQFLDYPVPHNPTDVARINVKDVKDYGTDAFNNSTVTYDRESYSVETEEIRIRFSMLKGTFDVYDKRVGKQVLNELEPIRYNDAKTTQLLLANDKEFFFGGGMQNGRFTHKGEIIHIENTNNWVDGGVTSPSPFYWSSSGYGVLRNTWQSGYYDFGSLIPDVVATVHKESHIDAFYFISSKPRHILSDYYELTGQPIFMPEYAFYEAHLNTFNRDYWIEVKPDVKGAIHFEDGKFYKSYQPSQVVDKNGILESLNGEKNNYQFSGRAMIDRYKRHDMPLGWFIPNDGYGSGYGQTDSLEGDIENLKEFIEYANEQGVEVALWTESNLEPKDPNNPKKGERDLSKEVGIGAVALKCDVAWIGDGYSFGLNAVEHATKIYVDRVKNKVRPLIIMVDGWAGTQRYSAIWSGDQTGGQWEYIRFHIPTYIGAGLSGLPIIGSDMDGIYGGGDREVNIRDYQWKTFTPLQLNMDGWGNVQKTPFSFDLEAITINRAYLKLKSMLLPYNYTIAHQSINGLPMVRAMFLEFPNEEPAYTKDSQYQFMWGPSLLVAPVYEKTVSNDNQWVRNGIYLPGQDQIWIDLFTGEKYQGGLIYNYVNTPLWKIPVFVKEGAIIPFVNENNNLHEIKRDCRIINIYPDVTRKTEFDVYEDDGKSADYLDHKYAKTKISVHANGGDLFIDIHKTEGKYDSIIRERTTLLRIMAANNIRMVKAAINGESININKAESREDFDEKENSYYYDQRFMINPYLKDFDENDKLIQKFLLIKIDKTDITESEIQIKIGGYKSNDDDTKIISKHTRTSKLQAPNRFSVAENGIAATSVTLQWQQNDASFHEIDRDGVIFSNIKGTIFTLGGLKSESEHKFRIRSSNDEGISQWSDYLSIETRPDPYKNTVKGISVTCNIPCQPNQEVCKLTERDLNSIWHTHWGMPDQANCHSGKKIVLSFDLEDLYNIEKIEYVPREDVGNGTFLKIRYRISIDGDNWSDLSPEISWRADKNTKTIMFKEARMQFFELNVLESVGGFGSGRNIFFFKKV